MGGGPRTFPGGLNKWQWKRLHEKKAREKENRLLDQEKQLYQARIRSQIRAKLASSGENSSVGNEQQPNYGPVSPQEHIRALADRFMKEGAEDLWNEDDGPINAPQVNQQCRGISEPIDLRKLRDTSVSDVSRSYSFQKARHLCTNVRDVFAGNWRTRIPACSESWSRQGKFLTFGWRMVNTENRNVNNLNGFLNFRSYSSERRNGSRLRKIDFSRNESSTSEVKSSSEGLVVKGDERKSRCPRFRPKAEESTDEDDDEDTEVDEDEEERRSRGSIKMMSSAALGKYDMKTKKRVPLKFVEDEDDLSLHVAAIRKEVKGRSMQKNETEEEEKETILSSKRYEMIFQFAS